MGQYLGQWAPSVHLHLYSWTSAESRKTSKILKKVVLSWCSTLLSTCRRKRRSLNMTVRWQQALQLLQPPERHCGCSTPTGCGDATETTEGENQRGLVLVDPAQKQKKCTWKSPSQKALAKNSQWQGEWGWWSRTITRVIFQSHYQGHHRNQKWHDLIPIPEWAMGDTRRFQQSSMTILLPG